MSQLTGTALAELYSSMSERGISKAEIVAAAGYQTESGRLNFTLFYEELMASGYQNGTSQGASGAHRYRIVLPVFTQAVIEVSSDEELSPEQILDLAQVGKYELVELSEDIETDLEGMEALTEVEEGLYISA